MPVMSEERYMCEAEGSFAQLPFRMAISQTSFHEYFTVSFRITEKHLLQTPFKSYVCDSIVNPSKIVFLFSVMAFSTRGGFFVHGP